MAYTFGTSGEIDDRSSRVERVRASSTSGTVLAHYDYTASGRLAQSDYGISIGQPDVRNSFHGNGSDGDYEGYDRFGRVKYMRWHRYSGSIGTIDEYDGLHRRIEKVDQTGGSDVDYDYFYNTSWQVLEVHQNGDATNPLEQFVWHPYYVDAVLVRDYDADTDGLNIEEHYYCHDANFNVTAIVDDAAAVVERYNYTPYGKLKVLDPDFSDDDGVSDIENACTFTGWDFDRKCGIYQFRNRYYGPDLGRFCTRDPLGYADGANLYAGYFVPNGLDPFGQLEIDLVPGANIVNGNVQRRTWMHVYSDDGTFIGSHWVPLRDGDQLGHQQEIERVRQDIIINGYAQGIANQIDTNINVGATLAAFGLPGPEDLVICLAAKLGYKVFVRGGRLMIEKAGEVLSGRRRRQALEEISDLVKKNDRLMPGPYAQECIPARGPSRVFTRAERAEINRIGNRYGCHSCGTKNPGTASGAFIPDHQPPNAIANGAPQSLYPHCLHCSKIQGGQVTSTAK